jgi:hypothetical protein
MGNHVVRTSVSIFPYSELGKNLKLVDHCWASGRDDTSFGSLTGNLNSSDLQAESSDITLNSGIPVYNIFYIQVFLSIHRMRPIKLTIRNQNPRHM